MPPGTCRCTVISGSKLFLASVFASSGSARWNARWTFGITIACLVLAIMSAPSVFAQRVALVVGNAAYETRPLRNPVNDAQLMQTTLRELGFDVQMALNADRRGLLAAVRQFAQRAQRAEVALFYFAGHGIQLGGLNYLIPLGSSIRTQTDVPDEAVDAGLVLSRIEESRPRLAILILDACRDNPYAAASRSGSRGLARMSAPTGTIVAYAASPGGTADDGMGPHGVYASQLARHLAMPGLDIKEAFNQTALEVERLTNGRQRPREEIGFRERLILKPSPPPASSPSINTAAPPAPAPAALPRLRDLPLELQRQVPPLLVSGWVQSADPGSRQLLVNGMLLREGDALTPVIRLEQIGTRSAVFSVRGHLFEVPISL